MRRSPPRTLSRRNRPRTHKNPLESRGYASAPTGLCHERRAHDRPRKLSSTESRHEGCAQRYFVHRKGLLRPPAWQRLRLTVLSGSLPPERVSDETPESLIPYD